MTKKYLPIILLLGSFLLFACSSPNAESNNEVQSMETQQEQPEPTLTETLPQEEPPAEEPQQTPTLEAATAAPAEPQADTDTQCYHPYFPIIEGASWTYDDTLDEDYTMRIEETSEDSFKMTQEMLNENVIFTAEWFCSKDGILRGSFGQLDLINQASGDEETPEFQFETLEWEGQTLPSPELLEIGYAWTSFYKLSANIDIEALSQSTEMEVIVDHEIVDSEEVTVPAGTFSEVIRVDSDGVILITLVDEENSTPIGASNFKYSTWYVKDLGMVKTTSEASGFTTGVSLIESSLLD